PPSGTVIGIDPEAIADGSLRILGSKVGGVRPYLDIPNLIDLYRSGRLKLDQLISGRYTLEDINEAFAATERGDGLRSLITYGPRAWRAGRRLGPGVSGPAAPRRQGAAEPAPQWRGGDSRAARCRLSPAAPSRRNCRPPYPLTYQPIIHSRSTT